MTVHSAPSGLMVRGEVVVSDEVMVMIATWMNDG